MSRERHTVVVKRAEQLWDIATRREFLRAASLGGAVVLLPSVFAACADAGNDDPTVTTSPDFTADTAVLVDLDTDVGILNFLFLFEQTEVAFYNTAVASPAFGSLTAEQQEVISDIRGVETIHREFLRAALGGQRIGNVAFNRRALNAAASTGASILRTAEMLEETGTATQIGAGKYIRSAELLGIAGKVNSVEARHAAALRDLREAAGIPAVGAPGTRFAGDDIVVPSGAFAGLNAKIEFATALQMVKSTNFIQTVVNLDTPPPEPGTPDFPPPTPTP